MGRSGNGEAGARGPRQIASTRVRHPGRLKVGNATPREEGTALFGDGFQRREGRKRRPRSPGPAQVQPRKGAWRPRQLTARGNAEAPVAVVWGAAFPLCFLPEDWKFVSRLEK